VLRDLARRARRDPLVRNSFFLMATSVATAGFGFAFWLVNARVYSPGDIGVASTVLSAVSLLSYLSLLGLNNLVVRSGDRPGAGGLLSAAVLAVTGVSAVLGLVYAGLAPLLAAEVRRALGGPVAVLAFVLLGTAATVNVLTDSAFIARRAAHYNLAVDAFLQGGVKLALSLLLVGLGSFGLIVSSGIAVAISAAASLVLLRRRLAVRLTWRPPWSRLRAGMAFSAGTYVSSVLGLTPLLVVPAIVLARLGDRQAGYYFITFQMATLLYALAYAVGESMFAEGSRGRDLAEVRRRSGAVMLLVVGGAAAGFELVGPLLLRVFGDGYLDAGLEPLRLLALGAVPVALNAWASFLLKASGRVGLLIASNVVLVVVVVGLTWWWADRGLVWVAGAWCLGNLASGLMAVVPVIAGTDGAEQLRRRTEMEQVTRIAVVNGYVRENAGDAALLAVMLDQLGEVDPAAQLDVFGMEDPRSRPRFEAWPNHGSIRRHVADGGIARHRRILRRLLALGWGLALFLGPRWLGRLIVPLLAVEAREEVERMRSSDLVVSMGGGYLRGGPGLEGDQNVFFVLLPILLAQRYGTPVAFAPQSFGPFRGWWQRWLVRRAVGGARLVISREDESLGWLASCGVPAGLARRGVDSGFGLSTAAPIGAGPVNSRAKFGVDPRARVLGVTARAWLPDTEQSAYEGGLADVIDHCQRDLGLSVVLIPQVTTDYLGDDDRVVERRIADRCATTPLVIDGNPDHRDLARLYGELDYLVGTRFHSVIFALTRSVPSLAIAYEHKTTGVMRDLGLLEWVVPIEEVGTCDLRGMVDRLVEGDAAYRAVLRRTVPEYVRRTHDTVDQLRDVLADVRPDPAIT
jgi:colanic acid/amylovoran biosynthesis protein